MMNHYTSILSQLLKGKVATMHVIMAYGDVEVQLHSI